MNRLRRSYKLPPDVQYAFNEFRRTGDIPKLDRDLDICIEREYNLVNKKGMAIFVSVIIAIFALLCATAFCDDHDIIIEDLDSDIGELGKRQSEILDGLVNLRIDVARITDHQHENQADRLRDLENELERLHGASNITMWVIGIIGILIAPTGITGLMRISRTAMDKVNGS